MRILREIFRPLALTTALLIWGFFLGICPVGAKAVPSGPPVSQAVTGDDKIATYTFFLVVGTLALVAVGLVQFWSGRRVSMRQSRANLFVKGEILVKDGKAYCAIALKNSGQTPAYGIEASVAAWLDEFPVSASLPRLSFEEDRAKNIAIGPGEDIWYDLEVELTPSNLDCVRRGSKVVRAIGEVRYRDAFSAKRWSRTEFLSRDIDNPDYHRMFIVTMAGGDG